jgi:hypothetical protein
LWIQRDQGGARHDAVGVIAVQRAEASQQPSGHHVVDPRHGSQVPSDLLGDQGEVDQRGPVAADGFGQTHRRGTHAAQPFPQALVEPAGLGRAHGFDVGVCLEELLVRGLQVLMVLGQAVVQPAQFIAVHAQLSR